MSAAVYAGAAILGAAESDLGVFPERTTNDLVGQAVGRALADAATPLHAIDGVFVSRSGELRPGAAPATELSEALGLRPRYIDTTLTGGNAPLIQVARAAAAVTAGLCSYAIVAFGSTQASRRMRKSVGWATDPDSDLVTFEQPTGYRFPISVHALIARRHMYEFGTTSAQLAAVAVSARAWASRNPAALRREPLSVEDVLASPVVSSPLHVLDCCLITDGAAAIVVGPAAAAPERAPRVRGFAERHSHMSIVRGGELTTSLASDTGPRALAMAGLAVREIDAVQIYDAFTSMPVVLLEDLGFCPKGDGGPFVASGVTAPGGSLPMNTQGGGLSHCHPGMYGLFLVVEAARQIRRTAGDRQLTRADHVLCHGAGGGAFGSHATLVLGARA